VHFIEEGGTPQLLHKTVLDPTEASEKNLIQHSLKAIESHLKQGLMRSQEDGNLVVHIPIENYPFWIKLHKKLRSLTPVREILVEILKKHEAIVSIEYVGGLSFLKTTMVQSGLELQEVKGGHILKAAPQKVGGG